MASTAAFFRVEGILLRRGALAASAYIASNAQGFRQRALKIGQLALAAPLRAVLSQNDRTLANRLTYLPCRDLSEDRIAVLSEEYCEEHLKDRLEERGLELLKRAKDAGHRVVLLSEGLESVMAPLIETLGSRVDELICNRMEIRQQRATGRLLEPVIGGHETARWVKNYAAEKGLDMSRSLAYGSHGPDLSLLSSVGQPCAVNPDYTLRRAARELDWPIVEYVD